MPLHIVLTLTVFFMQAIEVDVSIAFDNVVNRVPISQSPPERTRVLRKWMPQNSIKYDEKELAACQLTITSSRS